MPKFFSSKSPLAELTWKRLMSTPSTLEEVVDADVDVAEETEDGNADVAVDAATPATPATPHPDPCAADVLKWSRIKRKIADKILNTYVVTIEDPGPLKTNNTDNNVVAAEAAGFRVAHTASLLMITVLVLIPWPLVLAVAHTQTSMHKETVLLITPTPAPTLLDQMSPLLTYSTL